MVPQHAQDEHTVKRVQFEIRACQVFRNNSYYKKKHHWFDNTNQLGF
jgi:hypothetical protein